MTTLKADRYPNYMRRNSNEIVKVRGHMLDNRWVVPYNPYLLTKFDCHINVEICSTIKAVKYLYKYIYKGHDKIVFHIVGQHNLSVPSDETDDCCKDIEKRNILVSEVDFMSVSLLNTEQQLAYSKILDAILSGNPGYFFIDVRSGTGKTFLYRAILATIRTHKLIALATITSGVAVSLLPNGRTVHSWFKIPIDVESKICFGGKVVVFGSDFRQVLPVVPKSRKNECINATLVMSYIWHSLEKIKLTENMQAKHDPAFSNFLLSVGNGTEQQISPETIRIPKVMLFPYNKNIDPLQELIAFVFSNFNDYNEDPLSMMNRAILTPKNDNIDHINEILMEEFPGDERIYNNIDETIE
ncbi:uncharacterized protein LOC114277006 [Camellia sinensis]|uniref:uncharacterized protein LOC114277006 n=1 Tax=Camellia sinensis TaxID=4442 RepID=UPI00103556C5|nr:uncharacterized protein LOC114277006 [Camellia sinensis]